MHEGSEIKINGVVIGKVKSVSFDKVPEPIINLRDAVDYVPQQPIETTLSVTRFAVTETAFTSEILREALERIAEEDGLVHPVPVLTKEDFQENVQRMAERRPHLFPPRQD